MSTTDQQQAPAEVVNGLAAMLRGLLAWRTDPAAGPDEVECLDTAHALLNQARAFVDAAIFRRAMTGRDPRAAAAEPQARPHASH